MLKRTTKELRSLNWLTGKSAYCTVCVYYSTRNVHWVGTHGINGIVRGIQPSFDIDDSIYLYRTRSRRYQREKRNEQNVWLNEFKGYFFRCVSFFIRVLTWFGCCWNLWSPVCMLNIRNVLSNFQGLRQGHAFYRFATSHRAFTFVTIGVALPIHKQQLANTNRQRSKFVCDYDDTVENIRMEKVSGKRILSNATNNDDEDDDDAIALYLFPCAHTVPIHESRIHSLSLSLSRNSILFFGRPLKWHIFRLHFSNQQLPFHLSVFHTHWIQMPQKRIGIWCDICCVQNRHAQYIAMLKLLLSWSFSYY